MPLVERECFLYSCIESECAGSPQRVVAEAAVSPLSRRRGVIEGGPIHPLETIGSVGMWGDAGNLVRPLAIGSSISDEIDSRSDVERQTRSGSDDSLKRPSP